MFLSWKEMNEIVIFTILPIILKAPIYNMMIVTLKLLARMLEICKLKNTHIFYEMHSVILDSTS